MSRRTNKVGDMDARTARLFLAVRPLYYTLIAYGVVPVNFRRWPNVGLSFHPLRSTLAWALLVHATTVASAWRVWDLSLQVLSEGNPIASYANFPALLAIFHSANVLLLVPIWCEAHRYKEVVALAKTLVGSVNEDVLGAGWPRRHTVFMSWLWALALVVAAPAITFLWQFQLTDHSGDAFQ
ncbi:Gustatory receptor 18, partial [Frankliniella occidentalis]